MRLLAWTLQILILTAGIHIFLQFVRNTRGSRLIRGLLVSVLVGVFVLWGVSKSLELEELEHILEGAAGFIVVIFAIVFQPELRRGIAQIGEHSLVGRLMKPSGPDTVDKVVRAAQAMARRRHGALIAFERQTSLNAYAEAGTPIDAAVSARLVESVFQPKGALHDGAIVVRGDRIVAGGCFFPIPQEGEIDRSLGTRHRAALGISEESDAVVVIVSEETGSISLAQGGRIRTALSPGQVEEELRELLSRPDARLSESARRRARTVRVDWVWLMASFLVACGILYVAHQDIRITREFPVQLVGVAPDGLREPVRGELLVVLPVDGQRLAPQEAERAPRVAISGSRAQIDGFEEGLRGVFEVEDPAWEGGPIPMGRVEWKGAELGLGFRWVGPEPPAVLVERFASLRVDLTAEHVHVDATGLNPRFEVRRESIVLEPDEVTVSGPGPLISSLGTEIPLRLEAIRLAAGDRGERVVEVGLGRELVQRGFSLEAPVRVRVPIGPATREVGIVTQEVALVCMAPDRAAELGRWRVPAHAQTARFRIESSGLVPTNADPGSPAQVERASAIKRFVEENLLVFVDLAELPSAGEGRAVPIRWTWRRDWRLAIDSFGIDPAGLGRHEDLRVALESEPEILLEVRDPSTDSGDSADESGGSGQ